MEDILGGMAVGMTSGILNNALAAWREDVAANRQFSHSEQAADNADRRTRKLYSDFMSPEALLQQYKDAGLSPSLMFGGGGVGGQTPSGAQGAGSHQSSMYQPVDPMAGAQIELLKAEAEKAIAEADRIKGNNERGMAEIANIVADTKNKKAITMLTNVQKGIADINKEIAEATKGNKIEMSEHELSILGTQELILEEQLMQEETMTQYSKETIEDSIKQMHLSTTEKALQLQIMRAEKELKEAGISLTYAQVKELASQISKRNWDMRMDVANYKKDIKTLEMQWKQWLIEDNAALFSTNSKAVSIISGIAASTLLKFPTGGTIVKGFQ